MVISIFFFSVFSFALFFYGGFYLSLPSNNSFKRIISHFKTLTNKFNNNIWKQLKQ